ncbi:MAG: acetyl-CoA carboxylase biotin carboxyl carrier protein [Bryobacterales bacterium]|nr:acetyl-CoA carboxylase biotin carboxyl carrier protein [Bryobacterales bacterium]MBV9401606.1 acetyl-CoA carboxylase biotin carboxyl carrier protein [Bryobacterales bacterium]
MTIDEIKELLRLFNESGVGELELQRGEDRLRIRRAEPTAAMPQAPVVIAAPGMVAPMPAAPPEPPSAPPVKAAEPAPPVKAAEPAAAEQVVVKSPIVGTFYDAPSPDAPPFVKVGDSVKVGQVLCIVEAMKLLNEINAEVAGTIVSKFVENGSPVEYGERLYAIDPGSSLPAQNADRRGGG